MPNEENMTITETAPDGTVTTIDVTTTKPDDAAADGDKSLIEEVYEALFDTDTDDDDTDNDIDTDSDTPADANVTPGDTDQPMYGLTPTDDEISTNSTEFNLGQDAFPTADVPAGTVDPTVADVPAGSIEPTVTDGPDTGYATAPADQPTAAAEPEKPAVDQEALDQQAHADVARDAQASADEYVAQGDYKAAEQARETAENEAWEAGDQSGLHGSNAAELQNAGDKQDDANYYRDQQAYDVQHGNYEAAKEDAQNVAYATGDADYQASGSDHTAQADKDVANLDWAVWDQKNADGAAKDAEYYAAQGDVDNAEYHAAQADSYQATADEYGSHADPGGDLYQMDPSSEVASGGSYEPTYDAGAVDTGFDASAAAAPAYEPPVDDV